MKAKGVLKSTINNTLRHQHYKDCLFQKSRRMCEMNIIRSENHHLYIVNTNKIGLCAMDDKRYILQDGMDTLAFGHYKTKEK